ncbi:hypothetical protein M569_01491, partial [Genlisea aurea]
FSMESSGSDATDMASSSPPSASGGGGGTSSRIPSQLQALRFLQSPVSSLLEYSGILRIRPPDYPYSEAQPLVPESNNSSAHARHRRISETIDGVGDAGDAGVNSNGEVSIRIIGEQDNRVRVLNNGEEVSDGNGSGLEADDSMVGADDINGNVNGGGGGGEGNGGRETPPYQRYDIQQVARWIEQILPFSLLLMVVFIRQHLQGFVVAIYITAILFKSNDILRKQTALKGERKISVLVGYSLLFMAHVVGVYLWHTKDELFYTLAMIPPKSIPPFWHAVFIIVVNDTMVRQAAMVLKLAILMYYKNGRGHSFRKQGQMLTLVEYSLLLYRALLPTPVWYRFFLNKEYGNLFSSLITGLYLTFKLTSVVEKIRSFFTSLKALSRKEIHYGSYATSEQVNAAGDLCAICQEKMHSPILLRCKHIFCEDCVSEWFERERTCPLCRALVRPADLRSYSDGSTTIFVQFF